MFKNLQIKLLKYQKNYLQGKLFLKKTELLFSTSKKLQFIGLTLVLGLAIGGFMYGRVLAQDTKNEDSGSVNQNIPPSKTSALNYGMAVGGNITPWTITGLIIGDVPTYDSETKTVTFNYDKKGEGALGKIASATGLMYLEGPVGTQQYLAYLGDKANIGPQPTYAQSSTSVSGYNILQPVMTLWEWARNLVYVFYVIIFIIIGIMIILRDKIGGQVPITVINSIPNVIFSLILVTFSYAISGLIIDGMHLANGIIHSSIFNGSINGMTDPNNNYIFQSPEMSVFTIFGTSQITDFGASFNIEDIQGTEGAWIINNVIGILENAVQWNTLVSVVLSIAAVSAMFKLFFTLLTKYLGFMIAPITAPFQFFIGSLPGKQDMITSWFRGMLSSVGAFVGVYVVFCLMIIISNGGITNWSWFPPMTGFSSTYETIGHMLGYALFLAAPNVPALIEQALQHRPSGMFANVGAETKKAASNLPLIGGFLG